MKRSFQSLVTHKDGTLSGIYSVTSLERICIFADSTFTITGYYEAEEDELVELLFVYYVMPDGIIPRRVFERCVFSFIDFTRDQIDDVMNKLSRRKRPGNLYYSFSDCKVLSNNVELYNYPLSCHLEETQIPEYIRKAALKPNRENEYNLREMTINTNNSKGQFNDYYHVMMKLKRASRLKTSTYTNRKKPRLAIKAL
jgi:hypothetical protein